MDTTPLAPSRSVVCWFSCGIPSAVAAYKALQRFGSSLVIIRTPILQEHSDNERFHRDIEQWLGHPIKLVVNPAYPRSDCNEVWRKFRYMSNPSGAPCTLHLKKGARYYWEDHNPCDSIILGYTLEEQERAQRFIAWEDPRLLPILVEEGLSRNDCARIVRAAGIKFPVLYDLGFPNNNCIGCVKSSSPTYWNAIRRHFPSEFLERAQLSRELNARLVIYRGNRIFLDELPPDAFSAPMQTIDPFDCGLFCDQLPAHS